MTTRVTEDARRPRFSRLPASSLNARPRASEEKERLLAVCNKFRKVDRTFDGVQAQNLFLGNKDTHVSSVSSLSLVLFSRD